MKRARLFMSPPWVDARERSAVMRAFDSGYVAPCGPQVDAFEERIAALAGRRHAVAVSSGTAAIDLILAELGVDPSWTVVAPTLTFVATVGPAWHRGARIAFVDSDGTGNVDVALLEEALAELARTGADPCRTLFIGVDLYGRCCDYAAISRLCRRAGVRFVCDSAEAVGATGGGRPSGSAGEMAVYSFNGNKIVTTSGGGALLTNSRAVADRARKRAQQSREKAVWYEHREVGFNYRLSNILASVGLAQLDKLPEILRRRATTAAFYRKLFADRMLPPVSGENHWLSVAICGDESERNRLLAAFSKDDIEARPVWKPLHLQPVFGECRRFGGSVAENLFRRGICLPSGSGLASADRERIAGVVRKSLGL